MWSYVDELGQDFPPSILGSKPHRSYQSGPDCDGRQNARRTHDRMFVPNEHTSAEGCRRAARAKLLRDHIVAVPISGNPATYRQRRGTKLTEQRPSSTSRGEASEKAMCGEALTLGYPWRYSAPPRSKLSFFRTLGRPSRADPLQHPPDKLGLPPWSGYLELHQLDISPVLAAEAT